jgi:DnaJ-class molecular chaperone
MMNKAVIDALKADAEKLSDLTGEPQWFMVTCDNCGGEGGFYTPEQTPSRWDDPTTGERWDDCPTCNGSGWITNHQPAPELDQDELPPP